jgi:hypothetical protein
VGKQTVVTFKCDWCGATTPASKDGVEPDDWFTVGCDYCGTPNALLCGLCHPAREKAMAAVEAAQRQSPAREPK